MRWFGIAAAGGLALGSSCSSSETAPASGAGTGGAGRDASDDGHAGAQGGGAGSASDASAGGAGGSSGSGGVGEAAPDAAMPRPLGPASVLQHHKNATRDGVYVDAMFTKANIGTLHLDPNFIATIEGPTYAQPLYVDDGPGGRDFVVVATEQNKVYAIDAATGAPIWVQTLGAPVPLATLPCGIIDPVGITGTPIIDAASRTVFFDTMTTPDGGTTKKHFIFALSIDDGQIRPGWSIDVSATAKFGGVAFDSLLQNQRGALAILDRRLYVAYGGHGGDCGDYRGWVVSVPLNDPSAVDAWATGTRGGGIWGHSGIASDGTAIYVATGNTFEPTADTWYQGEAIVRLQAGSTFSGLAKDYFSPSNWFALDSADADISGTGPVLVDVLGATPSKLAVALAKTGVGYLVDRTNLGGFGIGDGVTGEGAFSSQVATTGVINTAAAYTTSKGTYLAFPGAGTGCAAGSDLVALKISATSPPQLSLGWCARQNGRGGTSVTTPDGASEYVVWGYGAEGGHRLWAFDADTGQSLLSRGVAVLPGAYSRRFIPPIVAKGRMFVAADQAVYAFAP